MASQYVLAVGKIVRGEIEMDVSMPPWVDPNEPVELPSLQQYIDECADTESYEDDIEDRAFWARGGW